MCSSAGPKILAFSSHCSANFQPILHFFIPNFKLKYEDSENIKADRVSTVVFNLRQIKRWALFLGHPVCESQNGFSRLPFLLSYSVDIVFFSK